MVTPILMLLNGCIQSPKKSFIPADGNFHFEVARDLMPSVPAKEKARGDSAAVYQIRHIALEGLAVPHIGQEHMPHAARQRTQRA